MHSFSLRPHLVKSERSFIFGPMPRVSEEHLAARRQQILDAARACFARNGFHATSMQDVVVESGLSMGAVYRYFRSKDDLIQAIAEDVVGMLVGQVDHLVDARPLPPLTDVMDGVLRVVETQTGPDGVVRMAIQVWGEALRNPRLSDLIARVYPRIRSAFVRLAARAREEGQLPEHTDPEQAGSVLFGLVPGYFLQLILVGDINRADYLAGLGALLGSHPRPPDPPPSS
jgi:AcrR family transcriptional regulator